MVEKFWRSKEKLGFKKVNRLVGLTRSLRLDIGKIWLDAIGERLNTM